MYVRGTEKERELVSVCVCVSVSVSVCVLECIRQCVCVSWNGVEEPVRGTGLRVEGRRTGSRNGVEGRGLELRVEEPGRGTGLRVRERIRNYSSSLLVVVTRVT